MSDDQPPSEPKASSVPVVRFGHNRFPPGVCSACHGFKFIGVAIDNPQSGERTYQTIDCPECKGTGRKEK